MRVCSAALAMPKSASLVVPVSLGHQQVAGLHVAVHHAGAVGVVEAVAGVAHDPHRLVHVEPLLVAQHVGARGAVHVLHDDVVAVRFGVLARVEHLHHVGVLEPRGGQRLAPEARDEVLVLGQVLGQQLDRHRPLQHRVGGQEHGGHAARAQAAVERVAAGDLGRRGHQLVVLRRLGAARRLAAAVVRCRVPVVAVPVARLPSRRSSSFGVVVWSASRSSVSGVGLGLGRGLGRRSPWAWSRSRSPGSRRRRSPPRVRLLQPGEALLEGVARCPGPRRRAGRRSRRWIAPERVALRCPRRRRGCVSRAASKRRWISSSRTSSPATASGGQLGPSGSSRSRSRPRPARPRQRARRGVAGGRHCPMIEPLAEAAREPAASMAAAASSIGYSTRRQSRGPAAPRPAAARPRAGRRRAAGRRCRG